MKRILTLFAAIMLSVFQANAQTGTWSGKLDVQGTKLSLVFHLDGDNPTMDSPDQGAKGIPIQIERKSYGGLAIKIPSSGASYEGIYMVPPRSWEKNRKTAASLPLTSVTVPAAPPF